MLDKYNLKVLCTKDFIDRKNAQGLKFSNLFDSENLSRGLILQGVFQGLSIEEGALSV